MSSDVLLERIKDWVEDNRDKFDGIDDWQNVKDQDIRNLSADQANLKAEVKCFELNLETLNFRAELSTFFHSEGGIRREPVPYPALGLFQFMWFHLAAKIFGPQ